MNFAIRRLLKLLRIQQVVAVPTREKGLRFYSPTCDNEIMAFLLRHNQHWMNIPTLGRKMIVQRPIQPRTGVWVQPDADYRRPWRFRRELRLSLIRKVRERCRCAAEQHLPVVLAGIVVEYFE